MSRIVALSLLGLFTASLAACSATSTTDEAAVEHIPNRHDRPIVEEDGRTLLWANEDESGTREWFDMTDSDIDPATFQYGIGKDEIPSIDDPVFASFDDPRVAARGLARDTPVLGIVIAGEARAYPVSVMSMHEVVNDEFGGEPYAVLW